MQFCKILTAAIFSNSFLFSIFYPSFSNHDDDESLETGTQDPGHGTAADLRGSHENFENVESHGRNRRGHATGSRCFLTKKQSEEEAEEVKAMRAACSCLLLVTRERGRFKSLVCVSRCPP